MSTTVGVSKTSIQVDSFRIRARCECGGEMKCVRARVVGGHVMLGTSTAVFEHRCKNCNGVATLKRQYPYIEHRERPGASEVLMVEEDGSDDLIPMEEHLRRIARRDGEKAGDDAVLVVNIPKSETAKGDDGNALWHLPIPKKGG